MKKHGLLLIYSAFLKTTFGPFYQGFTDYVMGGFIRTK